LGGILSPLELRQAMNTAVNSLPGETKVGINNDDVPDGITGIASLVVQLGTIFSTLGPQIQAIGHEMRNEASITDAAQRTNIQTRAGI
jgi:hypothetical protein